MNRVLFSLGLVLTLLVSACGNKGDLYLEPVDLTDEQKALLNKLEGKKPKKKTTEPSDQTEPKQTVE